ncbi:unnamed protein product [Soboliphyme baturini]|uniref:Uncharacterized protein n=1 Tax=Soboliphyme baturini TaxID=241478 RepID=A0A183J944_9BILA|nr:unnamed protein product [Soboliphyme baturini]
MARRVANLQTITQRFVFSTETGVFTTLRENNTITLASRWLSYLSDQLLSWPSGLDLPCLRMPSLHRSAVQAEEVQFLTDSSLLTIQQSMRILQLKMSVIFT